MSNKPLISYFNESLNQFSTQLFIAGKELNSEAIHDFRVAYKQLDSIVAFLNYSLTDKDISSIQNWLQQLNTIYRKGGKARNYNVVLKIGTQLKIWEILPKTEIELLAKSKIHQEAFYQAVNNFKLPRKQIITAQIKQLEQNKNTPSLITSFIDQNIHHAILILEQNPSEEWHKARKLIKHSFLLLEGLKNNKPLLFSDQLQILCGILEHDLGKWHDYIVFTKVLQKLSIETDQLFEDIFTLVKNETEQYQQKISVRIPLLKELANSMD